MHSSSSSGLQRKLIKTRYLSWLSELLLQEEMETSGSLSLSLSSDEADLLPGELFLRLYTLLVSMPGSSTPGSEIGLSVLDEPLLFFSALMASEA